MSKIIPPRPRYKPERILVGFVALAAFFLLFFYRLFAARLPFDSRNPLLVLLLEVAVFVLPATVFIIARGRGYTRALRLRAPEGAHTPLLIAAFFALFSGCLLLSILFGGNESLGTSVTAFDSATRGALWKRVLTILILAPVPAVAEELFFRGILITEYERRGAMRAILLSALLFALIHFDLQNLPVYLFSGALFALVLYATDSLVATMLLHILYNTVSLLGQEYLNTLYRFTGNIQLFLFLIILIFLCAMILLLRGFAKIYKSRHEAGVGKPRRDVPYNVQFHTTLDAIRDPAFMICVVLGIVGFILFR